MLGEKLRNIKQNEFQLLAGFKPASSAVDIEHFTSAPIELQSVDYNRKFVEHLNPKYDFRISLYKRKFVDCPLREKSIGSHPMKK
jgi:hypothetical protein